jgi:endonuclease YncB( thermonuclease family)
MGPDFTGAVVSVLDGDTLEVRTTNTLNVSASRSPDDTQKNSTTRSIVRLNRKNGEAHILACHQLGLLTPKIRPASPQNTANNKPTITIGSMITSWVDGGFD